MHYSDTSQGKTFIALCHPKMAPGTGPTLCRPPLGIEEDDETYSWLCQCDVVIILMKGGRSGEVERWSMVRARGTGVEGGVYEHISGGKTT